MLHLEPPVSVLSRKPKPGWEVGRCDSCRVAVGQWCFAKTLGLEVASCHRQGHLVLLDGAVLLSFSNRSIQTTSISALSRCGPTCGVPGFPLHPAAVERKVPGTATLRSGLREGSTSLPTLNIPPSIEGGGGGYSLSPLLPLSPTPPVSPFPILAPTHSRRRSRRRRSSSSRRRRRRRRRSSSSNSIFQALLKAFAPALSLLLRACVEGHLRRFHFLFQLVFPTAGYCDCFSKI